MKKTIYTIITVLLLATGAWGAPQPSPLSVGSSGFTIKGGTIFSVKGLVLSPSADVTITSNSINFSGTAVTNGSDQSISRAYTFTSPLSSYSGLVGIQYSVGELNGNNESDLQIAYNPLSSGGSYVVSSGSSTGSTGSYYVSNSLSGVNLGVVTALPLSPPTVTTNAATSITSSGATLNGTINANGASTTVTFEYGTTTSYGTAVTADESPVTGSTATSVSKAITGLAAGVTYHYRVVGVNTGGTTEGSDLTFTTPCAVPGVHLSRGGSLRGDYCTIQAAVNASQDGDVINIDAGTYTEQVTITKGITLQGAGRDLTIIESPDANQLAISGGDWKNMKAQDVFDIIGIKTTNDVPVTIKDLKINGRDQGFIPYPEYADNKGLYDFHGIGAYNTTVTIDNVYVTGVRNLASQFATNQENPTNTVPDDYLPADQPAGINHNDAIFAESSSTASEHTLTLTNSYITKFQKTAVLVWGPTLTVDINNNTIQGYGQTLWSTGNGIQVASTDRTSEGGANGNRTGTKGSVKNNQILDIGLVIPEPGHDGSYLALGLYSPAGVLLYEAGDDFEISGNTITRSIKTKSWHVDCTSTDGGFGSVGIDVGSSKNTVVKNNTIDGFDEAIFTESVTTAPSIIASNNTVLNNTIDYFLNPGPNQITLNSSSETLTYLTSSPGNDEISNFGSGDKIQVVNLAEGVVNGMLNGNPSINYSAGSVTEGNGTNVAAYSVQIHYDGTKTSLHIDTDGTADQAELFLKLNGKYSTENFRLVGAFIEYKDAKPTLTTTSISTFDATSATLGGNVTYDGGALVTERGVVYSSTNTSPEIGGSNVTKVAIGSGTGTFSESISSLSPGVTYYVQAYATNSAGTNYGGVQHFTTLKLSSVTTQAVSGISTNSVVANGNITDLGRPNPTAYGFCWSTSQNPTIDNSKLDKGSISNAGAFSATLTGLETHTKYYVRAYSINEAGTSYGEQVSFSTKGIIANVTLYEIKDIESTSAIGKCSITDFGFPNATAYGICWNTSTNPIMFDSKIHNLGAPTTIGFFYASLTELEPNTVYYARVYAANAEGIAYSNEISFKTTQSNPVITWSNPSDISYGTALNDLQLNATSNVEGTFEYTPAAGTKLNIGDAQELSVTFTPKDLTKNKIVNKTVQINVRKAVPVITWENPKDIVNGTALSDLQLNAVANTEGTFVYNPIAGTVLNTGDLQELTVLFSPADTEHYSATSDTVKINVVIKTGIDPEKQNSISIYPNPTTDKFYIIGIEDQTTIRISSLNGKLISEKRVADHEAIPVHNLPAGTYLIGITNKEAMTYYKLVKK